MRLSVTTKVFLGLALVVFTFGAVSLFAVIHLHRIGVDLEQVSQTYLPLAKITAELEAAQTNRARDLDRLLEDERNPQVQALMIRIARTQHAKNLQRLAAARRRCEEGLARAAGTVERRNLRALIERLEHLKELYTDFDHAAEALHEALDRDDVDPASVRQAASVLRSAQRRLGHTLEGLGRMVDREVARQVTRAETQEDRAALAIMGLSLLAILVALVVTLFVQKTLRPIRTLTGAARAVQEGHFDPKVSIEAEDEIGDLARAFNEMTEALASRDAALAEQRKALLRSERLATVGRMAAQVSHEIRNPLSSVGLNTELLGDELARARFESEAHEAEARSLLDAITREVDRLTEITEDYLRFARLPDPKREPTDLRSIVEATCSFSEEELRAAGVSLSWTVGDTPAELSLDRNQIRALLLNLLRNAREAMPGGGHIEVQVLVEPTRVLLRVDDDGPGVPPEARETIFEPFVSTRERGTGLGLALCAQVAAEHGGKIRCTSAPLGGARFEISLPTALDSDEEAGHGLPRSGGAPQVREESEGRDDPGSPTPPERTATSSASRP